MPRSRVRIEVPKALRLRVLWGTCPICDVILQPARDFSLGEAGDFLFPESVLGGRPLPWIRLRDGRIHVAVRATGALCMDDLAPDPEDASLAWLELRRGQCFSQSVGAFTLEARSEEPVASPVRRFHFATRGLGYFVGSFVLLAGVLALARALASPTSAAPRSSEMAPTRLVCFHSTQGNVEGARGGIGGIRGGAGSAERRRCVQLQQQQQPRQDLQRRGNPELRRSGIVQGLAVLREGDRLGTV